MPGLALRGSQVDAQLRMGSPPPVGVHDADGVVTATDDEENPIIAAINARRAGALSRADMVQQLGNLAASWDRSAVAARAADQHGGAHDELTSTGAEVSSAAHLPRRAQEGQHEKTRTVAVADPPNVAARRTQVDTARAQYRAKERSAAETRAQALAEKARAQVRTAAAEMERSQAARIEAVQQEARVAVSVEAEAEIARMRHSEERAEAARRDAERLHEVAQEQAAAALVQAEQERVRAQRLERDHAKAQAEMERFRKLEEQRRSELARLREQGPIKVSAPSLDMSALMPEPEPEPELATPIDLQIMVESDADSELSPESEPWHCSWCTDPNVLPEHRMLGPNGAAELCPACGIEFEALDADAASEDERRGTVDPRLFVRAPRLQLHPAADSFPESLSDQESTQRCEALSRCTSPGLKAQNPIALRSSSPPGAKGRKWLAWSMHSNNSTSSLAIKPVPRQPPARFVSPRATSPRAASHNTKQELRTRELKKLLFTKGLDSTGSREELMERYQEFKRREDEERALLCVPKKRSAKKSAKKQMTRAAKLAELSPRAQQDRARAVRARKQPTSRRTDKSFSPRLSARDSSPRRKPARSPRKQRPSKSARASAKLHDRHREKLQQEIKELGLKPESSVAEVREEKRRRAIEQEEDNLVVELTKRSVHSVDWRKEAAKETKSSMGEAAYGSVRQSSNSAEDTTSCGERMYQHAKKYADKREALIKDAEKEASAKARDGWKMGTKKREARARETQDTKPDAQQQSTLRDKPHGDTTDSGDSGHASATVVTAQVLVGAQEDIDSLLSRGEAETVSPLPQHAAVSQQPTGGQNMPRNRRSQRRPSEVLAADIAKLEMNFADLKDDIARAPSQSARSSSSQGSVNNATSPASLTLQQRQRSPDSRLRKLDVQKQSRAAAAGGQTPGAERKGKTGIGRKLFSSVKSPRSSGLEQERAIMQAKVEPEIRALEGHPAQQLPVSAGQQRLDALMGPDLAKVVDLLPKDQRQHHREELLTVAQKAPPNFDSPPASPRHGISRTSPAPVKRTHSGQQGADFATCEADEEGGTDYDSSHDTGNDDPLLSQLEDFGSTTTAAFASGLSNTTSDTSA